MALLTEAELTQKVEQVFAALRPLYAMSWQIAAQIAQLQAQFKAQTKDKDGYALDDDELNEVYERRAEARNDFWERNGGGAMSSICSAFDEWRQASELIVPLAQMWQASAEKSQAFARKGELMPQERLQTYEASAQLRDRITSELASARRSVAWVEESTQRTAQQLELIAAYLPLHDELVKLLNDHYYSGKVTRILAGRNWLDGEGHASPKVLEPSELMPKLRSIITVWADLIEVINVLMEHADELDDDDRADLGPQFLALWQEAGAGKQAFVEVVQLMEQAMLFAQHIALNWWHYENHAESFRTTGQLNQMELSFALESTYEPRVAFIALLDAMRDKLAQAAAQSDSQQKKFIEAYQRQYEELIALCRDPRQCAVVAKILSIMELF